MSEPHPPVTQPVGGAANAHERAEAVRALLARVAETAAQLADALDEQDELQAQLLPSDIDMNDAFAITEGITELMREIDADRARFSDQMKTLMGLMGMHAEAYLLATLRINQSRH